MLVILLLAQSLVLVTPEIIDLGLNMIIDASSDEVHFVRGFLKAPASIDLSGVRWITNEELVFDFDEDGYDEVWNPDDDFEDDDFEDDDDSTDADAPGTSVPTFPEVEPEDISGVTNVEDTETGDDIPEVEKEIPSDIPEEENEEDADSEGTDEPSESDVGGDDEDESMPTEDKDAVEEEKEIEGDTEETANEDENKADEKEASGTEEDAVDNVDEDEDQPESESTPVEEEEEPVEEEAEDVVEEPTPETGNDETDTAGDETEVQEEKEPSPVVEEADQEAEVEVEEEPSPETPTEDENDGGDEVEDETDEGVEPIDNGGNRTLGFTEFIGVQDQIMDIIVFAVPSDCIKDSSGSCDWVALGVGAYDDDMVGEMSYCCSKDTADRNICDSSDVGTMMIDHTIFDGDHRKIEVPAEPLQDFEMDDPVFMIEKTGDYVMVLANCNDDGFGVITLGSMEWKSVGGYLPGEMFDFMFFLGATSAIYLVIMVWYICGMERYQDAAIPIQKYILGTIILGFLAHFFKSIDFLAWNMMGTRSNVVMYIGVSFGILFQASLRCLGVMVALGWGVVRDTLGFAFCRIVTLGLLYAGLSLVVEIFEAAARANKVFTTSTEEELVDLALVVSFVIFVINIIFYVWIMSSLSNTTEYLKNMNQSSKLRRHLRLRCLVISSLVIITALTVVNTLQAVATFLPLVVPDAQLKPFLTIDQEWILKAVGYGNHLFILFGVCILWRPNSDAKDYAMQMQIPSNPDDENDLELSCVVPSADDMDTGEGYKIESAIST